MNKTPPFSPEADPPLAEKELGGSIPMDKTPLDKSDSEAYPKKDLSKKDMFDKPRQLFREIACKVSRIGKDSCIAAFSSISASKVAGKTVVLKMEIATRKRKMKEVFSRLGERVYSKVSGGSIPMNKVADIFEDVSISALIDTLKSCDHEIKEIEQYSGSIKKHIGNSINASSDTEGTAVSLSTCVEAIKDEDVEVRIRALKQFFTFDGSEVVPHLVNALGDKDAEIRRRAALYLGWKVVVSAVPQLIVVAKDRDSSVRKASLEALGELGSKEAAPALIKGLDDRDYEVRKTAYNSLTKVTGEFIEFNADGQLSERFKSIQRWEKWWKEEKK